MNTPNTNNGKETLGFQAEVRELLKLMIHSLYSHREIFLRELISNASDANDKLRFESLSKPELMAGDTELAITIEADADKKTLTIRDNGIGMSREEAISHLGTIARSGTAEFFKKLSGDQQKDSQLIGQFGVGFYSAFIVAERVEVFTRRAGLPAEQGVHWESRGEAEFTVEQIARAERGTTVVLHLRAEDVEFADNWRLRSIIKKYSDHIGIPVLIQHYGAHAPIVGAIGMLAGFCGTLMTPMAANINIVPAALLELKDQNAVIRAQVGTAIPLFLCNVAPIYVLAFPR